MYALNVGLLVNLPNTTVFVWQDAKPEGISQQEWMAKLITPLRIALTSKTVLAKHKQHISIYVNDYSQYDQYGALKANTFFNIQILLGVQQTTPILNAVELNDSDEVVNNTLLLHNVLAIERKIADITARWRNHLISNFYGNDKGFQSDLNKLKHELEKEQLGIQIDDYLTAIIYETLSSLAYQHPIINMSYIHNVD